MIYLNIISRKTIFVESIYVWDTQVSIQQIGVCVLCDASKLDMTFDETPISRELNMNL